jgi:hypothetical protein
MKHVVPKVSLEELQLAQDELDNRAIVAQLTAALRAGALAGPIGALDTDAINCGGLDEALQYARTLGVKCAETATLAATVQAVRELDGVNKSRADWCTMLDEAVGPLIPEYTPTAQDHDALEILEEFRDLLPSANVDEVKAMLSTPVIAKIKESHAQGNLYAKPIVLLVYWLLTKHPYATGARWPVPALSSGFDKVRTHLGISSR